MKVFIKASPYSVYIHIFTGASVQFLLQIFVQVCPCTLFCRCAVAYSNILHTYSIACKESLLYILCRHLSIPCILAKTATCSTVTMRFHMYVPVVELVVITVDIDLYYAL